MAPLLSHATTCAYRELSDDLGDLVHGWTTLRELCTSVEVNATFRQVADRYAALIQAALFSYCVSIVGRLFDQPITARRKTCCLRTLLQDAAAEGLPMTQLQRQLRAVGKLALKVVAARHARIAHNDFGVAVDETERPLFTFVDVDVLLSSTANLLNQFEQSAGLRPLDYAASEGVRELRDVAALMERGKTI